MTSDSQLDPLYTPVSMLSTSALERVNLHDALQLLSEASKAKH